MKLTAGNYDIVIEEFFQGLSNNFLELLTQIEHNLRKVNNVKIYGRYGYKLFVPIFIVCPLGARSNR